MVLGAKLALGIKKLTVVVGTLVVNPGRQRDIQVTFIEVLRQQYLTLLERHKFLGRINQGYNDKYDHLI